MDIRRDKNSKGQASGSDAKTWDARRSIDLVTRGLGNEVGADAQDDEGECQGDAWGLGERCELRWRRAGTYRARTENDEADDVKGSHGC